MSQAKIACLEQEFDALEDKIDTLDPKKKNDLFEIRAIMQQKDEIEDEINDISSGGGID